MAKRRIFIAINLPENIKKKLIEYQNKCLSSVALAKEEVNLIRWVSKSNLHITLVFIGYVDDDEMYEICRITKEVAKKHEPFFINLEKIILGPPNKTPRMFWVEGEKSEELAKLQTDLENSIAGKDYMKKEIRPYRPHINLARFKPGLIKSTAQIDEPFKAQIPVETIEAMQSNLKRTGAEYSVLESISLGEI